MPEILWTLFAIWLAFVFLFFVIAGSVVAFFIWVWKKISAPISVNGKKRY